MIVRPARPDDAAACQAVYAHHVAHGTGTFEEIAPTVEEMVDRQVAVTDRGLPYLVAEDGGVVVGFAYAAPFRLRSAYRYTVEDSVYVAEGQRGRGVGKALLIAVVEQCAAMGLHQIVAVIGDSANAGSVGVHTSCGFEMVGTLDGVGFKFDRFLNVVFMQKALNGGSAGKPATAGLDL